MGEDIPETEPVPAPPGCDGVNCNCWPAGETPKHVLLAFSGIRKCSDNSLWDEMNQDFILTHTGIACVWEFDFDNYHVQLLYWDHGFPPLQIWEKVSFDSIFKADMPNCTETGTWANLNLIGDCGGTVDGYGGFVSMFFGKCP